MESVFYGIKTLKLDIMIKYSEIKKVAKEKFGNGKYLTDKEDGFRQGVEWALEQVKNCSIPAVVGRSEQLVCPNCKGKNIEIRHREQSFRCIDCKEGWAN